MKMFVYVCAFSASDGPVCFKHAFVQARTPEEAYDKGAESDAFAIPYECVDRLNDYVIEIAEIGEV